MVDTLKLEFGICYLEFLNEWHGMCAFCLTVTSDNTCCKNASFSLEINF